jgi:hypothetical protein
MQKVTPFFWFDGNLEEAVNLYAAVLPNARVQSINPMTAAFEIEGQKFMASVANCAHAGSCLALEAGVVKVQKIRVPDTGHLSWIVIDGEHVPVAVVNEYLIYLHRLGRSPNTIRAYAHHLQAYWAFLIEQKLDWRELKLTQLAEFVSWVAMRLVPAAAIVPMQLSI